MPGRLARAACSSSMSLARSTTATSAASFCRTQALPPILASAGRALAAADILLHQLDLRRRHVDLRPAVELEFEMLFGVALFFQQPQAAITADAVGDVDHQVAFAQLQKAVDHAAQSPPRRPVDLGPMEQLVAADQHQAFVRPAENRSRNRPTRKCSFDSAASRVWPKISCSRWHSASVWQTMYTSCPSVVRVELLPHFGNIAAEAFDRLGLQPAGRFQRRDRQAGRRDRGKLVHLAQGFADRMKGLGPLEPVQIVPPLFFQLARLDEQEPTAGGR